MSNLTILNNSIRTSDNLYCLNDLHKASGNELKHQPSLFMVNKQTKELISEIDGGNSDQGIPRSVKIVKGGRNPALQGTWACQEIVIAYAAWISASFHLKVIRAFMDVNNIPHSTKSQAISLTKPHQQAIKDLVLGRVKNLPKEQQAGIIIKQWSALKTHFGKSYKDIDDEQFPEAISLLARLPLEGELIIDEPKIDERMLNLNSDGVNAVINCFYSATRMQEAVGCLLTNLRTFRSNTLDSVRFNYEVMEKYIRETQPHVEQLVKQRYKPQTPSIGNQKRLTA